VVAKRAFERTVQRLSEVGWKFTPVDFQPFSELARMLYEGPWVAERFIVMEESLRNAPAETLDPTVETIVKTGAAPSAVQAFRAEYQRAALTRRIGRTLEPFEALLVPTIPKAFTIAEVAADPIGTNAALGTYTNFTNLADLCGLAVPGEFREDGLPAGVTLLAPAWQDQKLLDLGSEIEECLALSRGATGFAHQAPSSVIRTHKAASGYSIAVVGAHLSGLALNHQLTQLAGTLVRATHTAAAYKLFLLPDTNPVKPGMVRHSGGASISVEIWELPPEGFAQFVTAVPPPLCIGNIEMSDGSLVKGFLCEAHAVQSAQEITEFGGFRQYLAASKPR
jgi:allophanate hydrolase